MGYCDGSDLAIDKGQGLAKGLALRAQFGVNAGGSSVVGEHRQHGQHLLKMGANGIAASAFGHAQPAEAQFVQHRGW